MELDGKLLGKFKTAKVGNRVAREHGEIYVTVRTSSPFRLRTEAIQGDGPCDRLSDVFDKRVIVHSGTVLCVGSGYWFSPALSIFGR